MIEVNLTVSQYRHLNAWLTDAERETVELKKTKAIFNTTPDQAVKMAEAIKARVVQETGTGRQVALNSVLRNVRKAADEAPVEEPKAEFEQVTAADLKLSRGKTEEKVFASADLEVWGRRTRSGVEYTIVQGGDEVLVTLLAEHAAMAVNSLAAEEA